MTPRAYYPVRVQYTYHEGFVGIDWPWVHESYEYVMSAVNKPERWSARLTLANGQRIIVRALSEERKAARRARQEAAR